VVGMDDHGRGGVDCGVECMLFVGLGMPSPYSLLCAEIWEF
jgi:hypothetical protein